MNLAKKIYWFAAGTLAASLLNSPAQPAVVTVTNYVTIVVTNVVTITNVVPSPRTAAAGAAIAASVPPAPRLAPTNAWESSVSAGLTLTRGNSDTMLFTADFLTQRKTAFDEYKIGLAGAYGDQDSKETENDYKAFAQVNHLFTERFYGYVRADGLHDSIANVDYRATVGPGLGYYLLKATNTTLAVEGGGTFEAEKRGNRSDTFATARLAERFEHKFNSRARIWENVEVLPQVDMPENYIVNFEIGLEAALSKSFSLKTFLDDDYQNRPAAGKLKNDAKIISAISYKF